MSDDFEKFKYNTMLFEIVVECKYPDLPSNFVIDEIVDCLKSKSNIFNTKRVAIRNIEPEYSCIREFKS